MKELIKKPVFIAAVVVVFLIIAGYVYFSVPRKPSYEFVAVKRGDVIQEVSVTGRVKPAQAVELAFEKSGRVAWVNAKVGDSVFTGQVLVQLENADLTAQLEEAEANVRAESARLEELKHGTRPEEIKVQEVKVANAKVALEDAKRNLTDKLQDAYTKSDDAVRSKADQFFTNPRTANPQVNFQVTSPALEIELESGRVSMEAALNSWKQSLDELTTLSDLNAFVSAAKKNLNQVSSFLSNAASAVNALTVSSTLSQTTIDGWKSDVSTARTNVNTAQTNLSAAEEKLKTAESGLTLAENELILKKAGTVLEKIAAQEAQVEQAQASVKNIQAQIAKTILRSPLNGIVTSQEAEVGEIVAANAAVAALMSAARFEIEANIAEADIAKIKIGNPAHLTLDAYGSDVYFDARVASVEPAETIIEGVATYKTTLQFEKEDERVKSGMTANIDISADRRENVLVLPQRSVVAKNGEKFVRILRANAIEEKKVSTGLRGSDGNIEILEGISEGDKVILFTRE